VRAARSCFGLLGVARRTSSLPCHRVPLALPANEPEKSLPAYDSEERQRVLLVEQLKEGRPEQRRLSEPPGVQVVVIQMRDRRPRRAVPDLVPQHGIRSKVGHPPVGYRGYPLTAVAVGADAVRYSGVIAYPPVHFHFTRC
jgi:hypothetical protein